jgi:hypothetical protein
MDNRLPEMHCNYDFSNEFENSYNGQATIYHYTSPEGLLGILNEGKLKLRFSQVTCLNDHTEGQEVRPIYLSVCKELLDSGEIDQDFYDFVSVMGTPTLYRNFESRSGMQICCDHDVYVCCFSKENDNQSLWNYYVKNDRYLGYSIGFKSSAFKNGFVLDHGYITLVSVIYKMSDKRKAIIDLLRDVRDSDEPLGMSEKKLGSYMAFLKYRFKSSHLSNEKEVRALLFYPHCTDEKLSSDYLTKDGLNFRYKEGIVIPYFDVEFSKDIFKSICIAPNIRLHGLDSKNLEQTIEYQMLSEYLRRNKYRVKPNTIIASTAPVRY